MEGHNVFSRVAILRGRTVGTGMLHLSCSPMEEEELAGFVDLRIMPVLLMKSDVIWPRMGQRQVSPA
jgi:hypothetical protein